MNQKEVMAMLQCGVQGMSISVTGGTSGSQLTAGASSALSTQSMQTLQYVPSNGTYGAQAGHTLWQYWQNEYYPYIIKESYPVYIQEKSMDKGAKAFEILKVLMDKGLVKIEKVKDFIEAMDTLIKTV